MASSSINFLVNLIKYNYEGRLVQNYAQSVVRELRQLGHLVTEMGSGTNFTPQNIDYSQYDVLLDLDCGRDPKTGELIFVGQESKPPIKSMVWFIDSHGNPTLHRRASKNYDHTFFAVWDKRDLFESRKSAHWCPNATDIEWFNPSFKSSHPEYDFGFFGSKMGLTRANPMMELCHKNHYTYDVRQIGKVFKHRWPRTAKSMGNCRIVFNHGQKHDAPNLRVVESIAMELPLISDQDPRSGMDTLFVPYKHYYPYEVYTYNNLETVMKEVYNNYDKAMEVAKNAFEEVKHNHLIKNTVNQTLEVLLAK